MPDINDLCSYQRHSLLLRVIHLQLIGLTTLNYRFGLYVRGYQKTSSSAKKNKVCTRGKAADFLLRDRRGSHEELMKEESIIIIRDRCDTANNVRLIYSPNGRSRIHFGSARQFRRVFAATTVATAADRKILRR